jgi:hypothetical protein
MSFKISLIACSVVSGETPGMEGFCRVPSSNRVKDGSAGVVVVVVVAVVVAVVAAAAVVDDGGGG